MTHRTLPFLLLLSACAIETDEVSLASSTSDVEVLAADLGTPAAITTDATHVYWVDLDTTDVHRLPKDGGAIETLATGADVVAPWGVAVDGAYVYYPDSGAVRRVPKAGGAARAIATGEGDVATIVVAGAHVYWSAWTPSGGRVRRVASWGGAAQTILTASTPSALVVDAFFVYVADAHVLGGSNRILRAPRGGGAAITLASDEDALGLAEDGGELFWKRFWTGDVRRGSKWMPGAVATIAADGGGWGDLDARDGAVWWSTGPVLRRVGRAGGDAAIVLEAPAWINSLEVERDDVYLALDPVDEGVGGAILRVSTSATIE